MLSIEMQPQISVIIVSYDMPTEIPRTVSSFLPGYQLELKKSDVEIIVIENGSTKKVSADIVESWPDNVQYLEVEDAPESPAWALNAGVDLAKGKYVCPVIDGARLASPRLLSDGLKLAKLNDRSFVSCFGYHLGSIPQQNNPNHSRELDGSLLNDIGWPSNPYRLFEVSCLGLSARSGLFGSNSEANAPILQKAFWEDLGGFNENFVSAGGGLVNLDFYKRALESKNVLAFELINEGTFHQFHGGETTSHETAHDRQLKMNKYLDEYRQVVGEEYSVPTTKHLRYGRMTTRIMSLLNKSEPYYTN